MASTTSGGVLDPKSMSDDQLRSWAASNSSAWHTDPENRSRYEAENKAINALLDERQGTKSTLDTTTGKWTTTGGTGGATAEKSSSGGMSTSDILALGQGPMSSTAAAKYVATGSTNPTTAYIASKSSPSQAQVVYKTLQEAVPLQQQGLYDLTEYLRQQKAAEVENALAGLKGAYEQSMAGYKGTKAQLPKTYDAARNSAAAQSAIARRTFDERAAAQGLSSGTAGQADLARSSAFTGTLAQIDQAQAGAEADIDLQMANLESQYQQAIQQAKASGDSQLASALYQELIRVQGLEREDEQLAYNRTQSEDTIRYNREQAEKAEAQERVNDYLAALGQASGLDSALVEQSGYTQAELSALEQYYANQTAMGTKPALTAAQVRSAIKAGNLTPNVLSAYEYYYGVPYSSTSGASGAVSTVKSSGSGTVQAEAGSGSYDNGSLTTSQVKELQTFLNKRDGVNISVDGFWGADSSAAAGGMSADEAWKSYTRVQSVAGGGKDNYTALESGLDELLASGASADIINSALIEARDKGLISRVEYLELRKEYRV